MYKPTRPSNPCLFCAFTQRPWRALGPDRLQRAAFNSSVLLSTPRAPGRLADEDERESDTGQRRSPIRYHEFVRPRLRTSELEKLRGSKRLKLVKGLGNF